MGLVTEREPRKRKKRLPFDNTQDKSKESRKNVPKKRSGFKADNSSTVSNQEEDSSNDESLAVLKHMIEASYLDPLIDHDQVIQVGMKPYCPFCKVDYLDLVDLMKHLYDKHFGNLLPCDLCLRFFVDADKLKNHVEKHLNKQRGDVWKCSKCNITFFSLPKLQEHELCHKEVNEDCIFLLKLAELLFAALNQGNTKPKSCQSLKLLTKSRNPSTLSKKSIKSLKNKTLHLCDYCDSIFLHKFKLAKHLGFHELMRGKKCVECAAMIPFSAFLPHRLSRYKSFSELHHLRTDPLAIKKCDKCESTLKPSKKDAASQKCKICHTKLDKYTTYESHILSEHSEKKSLSIIDCDCCQRSFVNRSSYNRHKAEQKEILAGYKYPCKLCDKRFRQPKQLFGHFASSHSEVSPFKCLICDLSFKKRPLFTYHIKLKHDGVGSVRLDENSFVLFQSEKPPGEKTQAEKDPVSKPLTEKPSAEKLPKKKQPDDGTVSEKHSNEGSNQDIEKLNDKPPKTADGEKTNLTTCCKLCKLKFVKGRLRSHMIAHHSKQMRRLFCYLCDKYFMTPTLLTSHMKRHISNRIRRARDLKENSAVPDLPKITPTYLSEFKRKILTKNLAGKQIEYSPNVDDRESDKTSLKNYLENFSIEAGDDLKTGEQPDAEIFKIEPVKISKPLVSVQSVSSIDSKVDGKFFIRSHKVDCSVKNPSGTLRMPRRFDSCLKENEPQIANFDECYSVNDASSINEVSFQEEENDDSKETASNVNTDVIEIKLEPISIESYIKSNVPKQYNISKRQMPSLIDLVYENYKLLTSNSQSNVNDRVSDSPVTVEYNSPNQIVTENTVNIQPRKIIVKPAKGRKAKSQKTGGRSMPNLGAMKNVEIVETQIVDDYTFDENCEYTITIEEPSDINQSDSIFTEQLYYNKKYSPNEIDVSATVTIQSNNTNSVDSFDVSMQNLNAKPATVFDAKPPGDSQSLLTILAKAMQNKKEPNTYKPKEYDYASIISNSLIEDLMTPVKRRVSNRSIEKKILMDQKVKENAAKTKEMISKYLEEAATNENAMRNNIKEKIAQENMLLTKRKITKYLKTRKTKAVKGKRGRKKKKVE